MSYLSLNGIMLHVKMQGTGRPMVLIHGLGSSMDAWEEEVKHWRKNHTVIRYDARGHGRSSRVLEMSLDDHVTDLKCLLDYIGIRSVTLIGTSMGGYIAQAFAIKYPEYLYRLILMVPKSHGRVSSTSRLLQEHADRVRSLSYKEKQAFIVEHACSPGTPKLTRQKLARKHLQSLPLEREFEIAANALKNFDFRPYLSSMHIPTLVLCGSDDPLNPPTCARELAYCLPHRAFVEFRNAGHFIAAEQPSLFFKVVDIFLDSDPNFEIPNGIEYHSPLSSNLIWPEP